MVEQFRYAAFVSYSSRDARFARRLHKALEGYGIPASLGRYDLTGAGRRPNRVYPVFRDREELSAGDLGERLEEALRDSATLIVVCSPHSAASPWVQKEIEYFLGLGRRDRVFAIIAADAPDTDENGVETIRHCLPPAFRGDGLAGEDAFEPLAADARPNGDGFRKAWLKLVAGMIGVNAGALQDRDRSRRRRSFLLGFLAAMAAVLAVVGAYVFRPLLQVYGDAYLNYRPVQLSDAELRQADPGTAFQDCRPGAFRCPVMVVVPAGTFIMGSEDDAAETRPDDFEFPIVFAPALSASPPRRVSVRRFAVSRFEITVGEWRACVDGGGCRGYIPEMRYWGGDYRQPVVAVSWADADEYVTWLSLLTGRRYRLLSEAEWEYAARANLNLTAPHTVYSWGNASPVCARRAINGAHWSLCDAEIPSPVGSFRANPFGLHDMHGNVFEWVRDCAGPYNAAPANGAPAENADCERYVMRGGSFRSQFPHELRSGARFEGPFDERSLDVGFRVAREIDPMP